MKLDKETAQAELYAYFDLMDIEYDVAEMDDESRADFEAIVKLLTKKLQQGALVFNDKSEPVYTPTHSDNAEPITFYAPKGDAITAMSAASKNEDGKRMNLILAAITREAPSRFVKLGLQDWKVCSKLVTLFLA